ncbi:MAG: YceI family protein [Alphaproteobacteria bacterium]|nr:YceI family protein [Alphaproteobacteria bacterium]MCB9796256.1 YceI family protein [Alphaproteobacteria bacterium]
MTRNVRSVLLGALLAATSLTFAQPAHAADDYKVDGEHTSVLFNIKHFNAAWIYGRFNTVDGEWTLDAKDASKSKVQVTIQAESVDTNNEKRDKHLRNADFFNTAEFPEITFTSKSVKKLDGDKWQVKGDLTLHGVTKEVTVEFEQTGEGPDPWGGYRMGLHGEFSIKRSDYGITHMADGLSDEVRIIVSLEGKKKKL